jgi:hypothetical protein
MSIQSLSDSLKKFLSNRKNFKLKSIQKTRDYLKKLDFLISDASLPNSLKLTKKVVLLCNLNSHKDNGSRLALAEDLILSFIKSAKSQSLPIPESLLKLLIVTYLNQSFLYNHLKPNKLIEAVIKASKVSENFSLKSRKSKLLRFNAKLRQCQLYTDLGKLDLCIFLAHQVLQEVLTKLEKKSNKKLFKEFVMVAVTAFYRIGICEKIKGLGKSSELAMENASSIIEKYLPSSSSVLDLDFQLLSCKAQVQTVPVKASFKSKNLESLTERKTDSEPVCESQTSSMNYFSPAKHETSQISVIEGLVEKTAERYYSKDRLLKLQKMMNEEKTRVILNTDNFFFKRISKNLAIHGDLKATALNIRENVNSQLHDVWINKEMLKKKKKNIYCIPKTALSPRDIQEKIEDLQENFESRIKNQDSKLKFKLKTKIYKKLLRSINVPVKSSKNFPAQRLFFRPPEKRVDTIVSHQDKHGLAPEHLKLLEEAKQEIEDHMEELKHDIEGVQKKTEGFGKNGYCQLARSTIARRSTASKVKKSIVNALVYSSSLKRLKS